MKNETKVFQINCRLGNSDYGECLKVSKERNITPAGLLRDALQKLLEDRHLIEPKR